MTTVRIASVVVGDRIRDDIGDLTDLVDSMGTVGLLQPIVIDGNLRLIAGRRRLAAAAALGWVTIEARHVGGLDDAAAALIAERDENTCRKPFTPSELVRAGERLEALERPAAAERKGKRTDLEPAGKLPGGSDTGRTTEKVAKALGTSRRTYEKAKAVVTIADDPATPEPVREVAREAVAEMNATGKVDPAHRKVAAVVASIQNEPGHRRLVLRSEFTKALSRASGGVIGWDIEALADALDDEDIESLERISRAYADLARKLRSARPTGLTVIAGGK